MLYNLFAMPAAKGLVVKAGVGAGLGNRIMPLLAGLAVAKRFKLPIYVDWTDGQFADLPTNAFYRYFELRNVKELAGPDGFQSTYPDYFERFQSINYDSMIEATGLNYPSRICRLNEYPKLGRTADAWFYWNYHWPRKELWRMGIFTPRRLLFRRHINFTQLVCDAVAAENVPNKSIGVHFRATDLGGMERIALFYKVLDRLPKLQIWLATDNKLAEEAFSEKYGNRVKFHRKTFAERGQPLHKSDLDRESMTLSALVDLIALSRSHILIGTRGSTFTTLATEVLGRPKKRVLV